MDTLPPILRHKHYDQPSMFVPDNLLREARRQKQIPAGSIPQICILDPDGDIVRHLVKTGQATHHPCRACYHTILIDRALRDEGTSYHYLPPAEYAQLAPTLLHLLGPTFEALTMPIYIGPTWTTDAPFRETAAAIEQACTAGILAVEMEAAALYAFAQARQKAVICLAHVTNQMGNIEGDFEKGEASGSEAALQVVAAAAQAWKNYP